MRLLVALVFALACPAEALADEVTLERTCAEIDLAADVLDEPDRAQSLAMLQQVLELEDQLVVTSGCGETYVLSHVRDGDDYVIRLRSPAGSRLMRTPTLDDLAGRYTRMVRSLLAARADAPGPVEPTASEPPARTSLGPHLPSPPMDAESPADLEPTPPTLDLARWTFLYGVGVTGGRAITVGYRRHLETVTVEGSFAFRENGRSSTATEGVSLAVEVLRRHRSSRQATLYGGGGLSIGGAGKGGTSGEGLQGELTGGIDVVAGSRHLLAQLDVTLPLYLMSDDGYAPAIVVSGGIGW